MGENFNFGVFEGIMDMPARSCIFVYHMGSINEVVGRDRIIEPFYHVFLLSKAFEYLETALLPSIAHISA